DGNDVSTDVLTAETTETGVKLTAGTVTTTTVAKVIATAAADSNITTTITVTILASDVAVENDADEYAEAVKNGSDIWVAGLEDSYVYTGTAIKPDIRVYYGTSLLTLNKDYSLKYANNTKVASSTDTKAPSITITFKGSYQNTSKTKWIENFSIVAKNLKNTDDTTEDVVVNNVTALVKSSKNGNKEQTLVPTLLYNGKALKYNKDFVFTEDSETSFADAGEYTVTLEGIGNFQGTAEATITLSETANNISSAKVAGIKKKYTYPEGTSADEIVPVITYKGVDEPLEEGTDYAYTIANHSGIGTATVTIIGMGNYYGSKKVTYKIVKSNVKTSIEDATVTLVGGDSQTYVKGNVTPDVTVVCSDTTLTKGTDYTVSYKNNKNVGTATVTIKGKGSYNGQCSKEFTIVQADLSDLSVLATDVQYNKKSNAYKKTKVTITDTNGKKLQAGKDYDKTFTYSSSSDVPDAGDTVTVTITAKDNSNYTGSITTEYQIYDKSCNIAKAKVSFNDSFEYTGQSIKPDKDDMTITLKSGKTTTTLTSSDYEIVSYSNNVKAGTAKVTIRGIGDYGGMKTVSFKIQKKSITQNE
ncbi:MAG: hypothetical protein K6A23_04180, partial [Butyrivibrio sp.]|nr:hypothetical protein [Butyrivibrio sp.]